jgi:hypothetical protein
MTAAQLNVEHLIQSLLGVTCPLCGGKKGSRKTVCFTCWKGVPRRIQKALYQHIGEGYEQAFAEMCTLLDISPVTLEARLTAPPPCKTCKGKRQLKRPGGVTTSCPACGGEE